MKSRTIPALMGYCIIFLLFACDRPDCKNTNRVFDLHEPTTVAYKTELLKEVERVGKTNIRYWFKEYIVCGGKEMLLFNIQGEGLCAILALQVNDWTRLEELHKKKGVSFRGAEFINLTFDVTFDSTNPNFILKDFERIKD